MLGTLHHDGSALSLILYKVVFELGKRQKFYTFHIHALLLHVKALSLKDKTAYPQRSFFLPKIL
jgi:hypothetical protein